MNRGMFVLRDDGALVELQQRAYDSEALLQRLLATHPNLLAGDQMSQTAPRRWLLVTQEMAVPADETGAGRWSVDHLFLDQDAIPTIVEVKRSSDTRIRREVVGQVLEYAANATVFWPVDRVTAAFERTCASRSQDAQEVLTEFLAGGMAPDEFWQAVKTNLQAGRVRLVFVADIIPPELHRIVEFLNRQMDPAEVLAVEIRQYVGEGLITLVPRVVGQTAEAQQKRAVSTTSARHWDEASFFQVLEQRRGADEAAAARRLLAWAEARALRLWWGTGKNNGSVFPVLDVEATTYSLIAVWTNGSVEVQFQHMNAAPFGTLAQREQLRERLNRVPGIQVPKDALTRRPSVPLAALVPPPALTAFLEVLDWYIAEARSYQDERVS